MIKEIIINQPDDFHIHLRDGDALKTTVLSASEQFGRAVVMPNLVPPITTTALALEYAARIKQYIPMGSQFTPLMTLYLTDTLTADEIRVAYQAGVVAVKLYPQGVTTNSAAGVSQLDQFDDVFAAMQESGMLLLIHGESSQKGLDIFDREGLFIQETLIKLTKRHPKLKIVLEHISTKAAVDFVMSGTEYLAATITPQHLLANRNHLLSGGIKPHYYCLPILKTASDQSALLAAATSGNPKFFLGTDSAPHATNTKESSCGCAGCYTAPYAIEYYATAFDKVGRIDRLGDFSAKFGAEFYGLSSTTKEIKLIKKPFEVPLTLPYLDRSITPFMAGDTLDFCRE